MLCASGLGGEGRKAFPASLLWLQPGRETSAWTLSPSCPPHSSVSKEGTGRKPPPSPPKRGGPAQLCHWVGGCGGEASSPRSQPAAAATVSGPSCTRSSSLCGKGRAAASAQHPPPHRPRAGESTNPRPGLPRRERSVPGEEQRLQHAGREALLRPGFKSTAATASSSWCHPWTSIRLLVLLLGGRRLFPSNSHNSALLLWRGDGGGDCFTGSSCQPGGSPAPQRGRTAWGTRRSAAAQGPEGREEGTVGGPRPVTNWLCATGQKRAPAGSSPNRRADRRRTGWPAAHTGSRPVPVRGRAGRSPTPCPVWQSTPRGRAGVGVGVQQYPCRHTVKFISSR